MIFYSRETSLRKIYWLKIFLVWSISNMNSLVFLFPCQADFHLLKINFSISISQKNLTFWLRELNSKSNSFPVSKYVFKKVQCHHSVDDNKEGRTSYYWTCHPEDWWKFAIHSWSWEDVMAITTHNFSNMNLSINLKGKSG